MELVVHLEKQGICSISTFKQGGYTKKSKASLSTPRQVAREEILNIPINPTDTTNNTNKAENPNPNLRGLHLLIEKREILKGYASVVMKNSHQGTNVKVNCSDFQNTFWELTEDEEEAEIKILEIEEESEISM